MHELFYILALVLLASSASIGDKICKGHYINQPFNKVPIEIASGFASILATLWFIYGFFISSWWIPLIGIFLFATIGSIVVVKSLRKYFAPLICILLSIFGTTFAVLTIILN